MWSSWLQTTQTKTEAVGRSIILQGTMELCQESDISFRSFKEEATREKELKLTWNKKMQARFAQGASEKEAVAQDNERKRLELLEKL